jgi:endonuclease G
MRTKTLDVAGGTRVGGVGGPPPVAVAMPISDIEARYGWAAGGWQDQLLRAADTGKTGKISAAQIDAYLANPADVKFLTSKVMDTLSNAVGAGKTIASLPSGWEQAVAKSADKDHNGTLTQVELSGYLQTVKTAATGTLWIPDQKAAELDSSVKDVTGEADLMKGNNIGGTTLQRGYMRIVESDAHRTANMVSYTLTAADQHQTLSGVQRKNNFHIDPQYAGSSKPTDYDHTEFDRGHQKPAEDSPNMEAMDETFLMTNMAPQTKVLNEQSWKYLEEATRELGLRDRRHRHDRDRQPVRRRHGQPAAGGPDQVDRRERPGARRRALALLQDGDPAEARRHEAVVRVHRAQP